MGALKGSTTKMAALLEVTSATTEDGGGEGWKSLKMPVWRTTCLTSQGWRHQAHAPWVRTKKGRDARTPLRLVGCLRANLSPALSQRDFPRVSSCADTGCGLSGTGAWREAGRRRQAAAGMPPYRSRCATPLPFYKRPPRPAVLCRLVPPPSRAPAAPLPVSLPPRPSSPGKWRKTQNHQGRTVEGAA